jgi:hypothetical protein
MRDTCRCGCYVDLGSELQIVPNGGQASEPSEGFLLDERLDVRPPRASSREGSAPPALNTPDGITPELHGHFPSYCHA